MINYILYSAGFIIEIIGLVMLSQDLIWGYKKRLIINSINDPIKTHERILIEDIESIEQEPLNHSYEDKKKLFDERFEYHKNEIEKLKERIDNIELEHSFKVFKRGMLGFVLIIIGLVWQITGTIITSHKNNENTKRIERLEIIISKP